MIDNIMTMDPKSLYSVALGASKEGADAPVSGSIGYGCCRVYVYVGYKALRRNSKAAKALKKAGFRITPRPYDKGGFIYVGYDNSNGVELTRAKAIAEYFKGAGIAAGVLADGD